MGAPMWPAGPGWHMTRRRLARQTTLAAMAAVAALSMSGPAHAGTTDLLTLAREALENDPTYASARYLELATAEATPQARANLLPSLSASLGEQATRYDYRSDGFGLQKTFNSWGPSLQLNVPVYNAQLWQSLDQAQLTVHQGEAQLAQARADVLTRVAQAYFDVLAAQDALSALRENKKAVSEQLAQAKREFEVGTKTIVDTHEAKARYDQIDAQEQVARGDLAVKQSALRAIIGRDAGELVALRDPVQLVPPQPNDIDTWARNAENSNHAVLAARAGSEIAHHETRRARDAYLPTVNISGNMAYARSDNGSQYLPGNSNVTQSTLGLTVTIPVFTGGAIQSKVREAHAREDKADRDLEFARRSAAQAARQAYTGVDYGLAQVQALESAEISARTQLDSTRLGYQVGVRINLDVLNANTQLFGTQRDLKKARYDFLLNSIKLKAAAGALQDADIETVNALLQR